MGVIYLHRVAYGKGSGSGGASDYNDLSNKPTINDVALTGNKTGTDLKLIDEDDNLTPAQINDLLDLI